MDVLAVFARLRVRQLWVILAFVAAVVVALSQMYSLSNGLARRSTESRSARAQILVDTADSTLASLEVDTTDEEINTRTPLYAEYAATSAVKPVIAGQAHISPADLSVTANTSEVSAGSGPTISQSYNSAPAPVPTPYSVVLTATNELPVITINTSAPTVSGAVKLASAAITGLQVAVKTLGARQRIPKGSALVLRPLGPPIGGSSQTKASIGKGVGYGLVAWIILCLLVLAGDRLLSGRASRASDAPEQIAPEPVATATEGA